MQLLWQDNKTLDWHFVLYGYHQRENTGSRLFTEVKLVGQGWYLERWPSTVDKLPCAVLLGGSGWHSGHQSCLPPLLQCCLWIEFQSISTWLWGFFPGTRVSSLLKIDSLIKFAGPHWYNSTLYWRVILDKYSNYQWGKLLRNLLYSSKISISWFDFPYWNNNGPF